MAQSGKKNLALFQALRKEMAAKAKIAGNTDVPNIQESLVEVHVHGGTKRKAEFPARPGKGKDVRKVRAALLGSGSSSGTKGLEFGLIELPKTSVRKDIDVNLPETIINSINSIEPNHLVRTMVEFGSKALILSRRVGSLYRREVRREIRKRWRSCKGRLISLRRRGRPRRKRMRVGRRRRKGWEHERFDAWIQRVNLTRG